MKTIAIMQPYFLPYIGYFQLMAAVDKFVVFDDVHYINRGWVNRNRLLLDGAAHTFTLPLRGASQNRLICEIELVGEPGWRDKLLRTIRQAYAKAPCFAEVFALMERLITFPAVRLDEFLLNSLREVAGYLALEVEIEGTSRIYRNSHLGGQERILDICRQEHADIYINPVGGEDLYDRASFRQQGIQLKFLRSRPVSYAQGKGEFVPWLSILDVLMFNPQPEARQLLAEMDLA
ncbi:WbqC family protein [Sideroxydans lithotrophicus]|uniref:WbqC-like family protein n=1 Tax=Sideroxydans lithotrophicus (strain ES-1) TaxID=580332 RepID=D5CN08_SIDLE|nr:WbqC family protein [Sideroxydans lithotrophicus]ADE10844.1 WbqC-like family protein [Sideroxydans lithotrophicus ES-1]